MKSEAKLLEFVNSVGVGPKFFVSTKNFIVMEYLDGEKIGEWITYLTHQFFLIPSLCS